MESIEYQEYLDHFSKELSPEIKQYATDDVFKSSRYIFYSRSGKHQKGYCTHCRTEFKTDILKHNTEVECPNCRSHCKAKASGMGRSRMIDDAYFVYYEKSTINPKVIVARGIYAVRDYREDYHNLETQYLVRAMYIFEMGNSVMISNAGWYSWSHGLIDSYSSQKSETIYSLYSQHPGVIQTYCQKSLKEAIKDTPFQYSTYEEYANTGDKVKFLALYSKYPCIEYLTKLGMKNLVEAKYWGRHTYSAINWRGKNLQKVLKLSKKEINEIKASNIHVDPSFLRLLQITKNEKSNLSVLEISEISSKYSCYFKDLQKALKYTSLRKINSYIDKQYTHKNKDGKQKHWYGESRALMTWNDYIADCIRLEMDITSEQVLFPSSLYNAHQNTIKQVKIKSDEMLSKKINLRLKSLQKYYFESSGLMIRPAVSSKELIDEGKALNHCVGTYADRYAQGETDIFVIRKASEPDKPYFTVEVRKTEIIQVRGNRNCSPSEDVSKFIKAFKDQKLTKKKTKVAVSA